VFCTSAVGRSRGGFGFSRDVVWESFLEKLKRMTEFMGKACAVCYRKKGELGDVASAGKSESKF